MEQEWLDKIEELESKLDEAKNNAEYASREATDAQGNAENAESSACEARSDAERAAEGADEAESQLRDAEQLLDQLKTMLYGEEVPAKDLAADIKRYKEKVRKAKAGGMSNDKIASALNISTFLVESCLGLNESQAA